jgi:hypothetical protein
MSGADGIASLSKRLQGLARSSGADYQRILADFAFERLLYRLSISSVRERFVLKGAMLLRVWSDRPYRATRDLDLLRAGDGNEEAIRRDWLEVCTTFVEPDGLEFDANMLETTEIRAANEYAGQRIMLPTRFGKARLRLQIDVGVGDTVWPSPRPCSYPSMLGLARATVLSYPPETVVAEKLEALVVLGDRNSRIKDFFGLHYLAGHMEFELPTLVEAARRTFQRRGTPVPTEVPFGLTPEYWANPSRPAQVLAFARRALLEPPVDPGTAIGLPIREFLDPIVMAMPLGEVPAAVWLPGGPWRLRQ